MTAGRWLGVVLLAWSLRAAAQAPAAGPPATGQLQDADGDDAIIGRALQLALRAHGTDVYGCYDKAQTREGRELAGELLVRVWVAPGGAVPRAEILKDQLGSKPLDDCLIAAILGWKVPELSGPDTRQVVFPLVFKPDHDGAQPVGDTAPVGTAVPVALPASANAGPVRYVVPLSEGKPGPLGITGRVEARVLIDATTVGPTMLSLTQLVLHPTARLAPHTHPGVLEALYVVKGLARVRGPQKGTILIANGGDLIVMPAGGVHNVESAPLAPLTMLQIFAPGGPEHAYRDPLDRSGTIPAHGHAQPEGHANDAPVVVHPGEIPQHELAGGRGHVQLLLDNLPVGAASIQRLEIDSGGGLPLHDHERSDEVLYVLSGRGELTIGGAVQPLVANDAVHVPMGVPHSLRVSERMVAIQCFSPGGPEQREKKPAQP